MREPITQPAEQYRPLCETLTAFIARPENVFIIFWLMIALCAAIFSRPWTGLDEGMHIARVEQIAEGGFLPQEVSADELDTSITAIPEPYIDHKIYGGQTDSSIYELLIIASGVNSDRINGGISFPAWSDSAFITKGTVGSGTKVTWAFPNASLNSPFVYLPHALGFLFARIVTTSPWATIAFMRVFGVLAFGALGYLAVKKCPFGKWLIVAVLLSPNSVSVNSMVSADVMTNAFVMLYLVFVLRFLTRRSFSRREWIALAVSLCGVALAKMPYICFGLLLFVLVGANPSLRTRSAVLRLAAIGFGSLMLLLLWSLFTKGIESYVIWGKFGVDQVLQKQYVIAHPLSALAAIVRTLLNNDLGLFTVSGYDLGGFPCWAAFALYLLAFMVESKNQVRIAHPRIVSLCLLVLVFISMFAIGLALYLTFTDVGSSIVDGVQSRYFLPLLYPTFVALHLVFVGQELSEEGGESNFLTTGETKLELKCYKQPCGPILIILILMACLYFRVYAIWMPH